MTKLSSTAMNPFLRSVSISAPTRRARSKRGVGLVVIAFLAGFVVSGPAHAQGAAGSEPVAPVTAGVSAPSGITSDSTPIEQSATPGLSSAIPHDLSPWSMFMAADVVVKGVMVGLAFASLVTWTIFIGKGFEIARARVRLHAALGRIAASRFLVDAERALHDSRGVLPALVDAAIGEAGLSSDLLSEAGIKERAASALSEVARAEARAIRRGMGLLATIGSTAPFVGLFGTVWGIMNSFIGISKAQTTNLAVVAPGIAEALLATAIGLVAAIPAVIIYNVFVRQTKTYVDLVGDAMGRTERLLSRDLDRSAGAGLARAAE